MNMPSIFDFLGASPKPDDRPPFDASASPPADIDIDRLLAQLLPSEATTRMATHLLAQATARLLSLASSLPAPVLVALALVASLSAVRAVHRAVTFATRLLFRLVFWAAVLGLAAALYERGVGGSVGLARDACGYAMDVGGFFWREWERFDREREGRPGARAGR